MRKTIIKTTLPRSGFGLHPDKINSAGKIRATEENLLVGLLTKMLLIRRFEEKIIALYDEQEMKTPVHLCIGQEAVAAGVCQALEKNDYIFSNHRGHGHYLAKGGSPKRLAAELYGRKTGCSSGKGGSMHLVDTEFGVCGSTGIVGGGIPLATGAALASAIRGDGRVSAVFFGDGAADGGGFFESMGLASLKKLPVVFVIENNFYATCSSLSNRRPSDELYNFGRPHGIPSVRVDGNDAVAVYDAARRAVDLARAGGGPSLIEAVTYRWMGHVGRECDVDKGYRDKAELAAWKIRCPLNLLQTTDWQQLRNGIQIRRDIERRVEIMVAEAFAYARKSPYPSPQSTYENVW